MAVRATEQTVRKLWAREDTNLVDRVCLRNPRVSVVQTAKVRNRDDLALRWLLDLSLDGCVPVERQVGPRMMIIVEVVSENANQVPLVQNGHMIQAFFAN